MNEARAQDRNQMAAEYLGLLNSLAMEMERAMEAITQNRLSDLEESVALQQVMSGKLSTLVDELCGPLQADARIPGSGLGIGQQLEILLASKGLHSLNQRYAALLRHSTRSVALMASFLGSLKGQMQEASGPRLKHQTWSCQM